MTHIDEHFTFGRIAAPDPWNGVDKFLRSNQEPAIHPWNKVAQKRQMNNLIKRIRRAVYTPDRGKDTWTCNIDGDCEDKCLYLMDWYMQVSDYLFHSLRLAICELPTGQQHAVLLLYTEEGTKVIDPTLSTMAVPWEKYPVNKWIIRHRNGFLWENFKEKEGV